MSVIRIENMRFYAFHGCFDEEQRIGTRFRVDLSMQVDTAQAQRSDRLEDTVNYLSVYRTVKEQMETPSHLLEHVADRIGEAVLEGFPAVERLAVKVTKLNPPLGGQMEGVSVELDKGR
ncbi:MAG: dihydroneopterin aldolase [Bacteroidales bacterium]|nr:dihydroneopterin aldolase [Bacteroidales bacterium]